MRLLFILSAVLCFYVSCQQPAVPRPRGFFRIDFPEKKYKPFDDDKCPYTFETAVYSEVLPDTNRFAEPCWKYVVYPTLHAQLYLTYKPLQNNLASYAEDSRNLVYKHTIKANAINEMVINTPNNVYGIWYDIGGNAASNLQFYVSDSVNHFIRGSLYFNAAPEADSLKPVIDFVREDVLKLINTLKWKK